MLLYFVSDENAQNYLRGRGIPVLEQTIGGLRGVVFPASHRERALDALNWNPEEVKEIPTGEWSINQLTPNWQDDEPRVQSFFHEETSPQWHEYIDLVVQYCQSQELGLPAVVHYRQRTPHPIYENGKIHLCFGGTTSYHVKVWSYERDVYYQRLHLWIGELGPEHAHCRALIPTLLAELLPRITEQEKGIGQTRFTIDSVNYLRAKLDRLTNTLTETRNSIESLQNRLIEMIRREEEEQTELKTINSQKEETSSRLNDLFNQIKNRHYVKQVRYKNGVISIFTERIAISCQNALYDIGEFQINIHIDGRASPVSIYNLTRRNPITGYHHPHVNDRGGPCLGTIKRTVTGYIAHREYLALADILYAYLQNVDPNDAWGRQIGSWPRFQ